MRLGKKIPRLDNIVACSLWSDPCAGISGTKPNADRGMGSLFGRDVAHKFLRSNKFKLLIRSHECADKGFEYCYAGCKDVCTLFSASNYQHSKNDGAVIQVFSGSGKKASRGDTKIAPGLSFKVRFDIAKR